MSGRYPPPSRRTPAPAARRLGCGVRRAVEGARALPFFVHRLLRFARVRLPGWRLPLPLAALVFVTSWGLMALAMPAGSEIVTPAECWWYFVVTAATVGPGDLFPWSLRG